MQSTSARPICLPTRRTRWLALLFPLLAASCQTLPPTGATAVLDTPVRAEAYIPRDAPRYAVDAHASEIRLLVYREGPLERFGHNHVIVGSVAGEIFAGGAPAASGFRLEIPVASFAVDPPPARAEEGIDFAAEVSEQARHATRENMLGTQVLDAARHPLVRIESLGLVGPQWNPTVTARATVRGASRDLRFPCAVFQRGGDLAVIANFRVEQSAFGIEPFAALGGGLRVRDAIEVRIRILARRAE